MQKDGGELLWPLNRKQPQHGRIHHAEDRRVRADAERERCDGSHREAFALAEGAKPISQIGAQFVQQLESQTLTSLFLVLLHRSELESRDPHGFFWREAAALDQILGAPRKMEPQFVRHIPLHFGTVERVAPERTHAGQQRHYASCARSAVLIARAVRFQRSLSVFNRFRPAAVSR